MSCLSYIKRPFVSTTMNVEVCVLFLYFFFTHGSDYLLPISLFFSFFLF